MKGILARLDKRKEVQRHQSTRQLMGIEQLTGHGAKTAAGELLFYVSHMLPAGGDNILMLAHMGYDVLHKLIVFAFG